MNNNNNNNSHGTVPSPPSEREAKFYYTGLPSRPVLVARTGTTPWEPATGPDAYRPPRPVKELGTVGNHAIKEAWETLYHKVLALLDEMEVKWISVDIVRIGNAEEDMHFAPVILWIGVMPASLSGRDGVVVASKCREILVEHGITDVDVEIRESVIRRWWTQQYT
jgi:hypothetical protein